MGPFSSKSSSNQKNHIVLDQSISTGLVVDQSSSKKLFANMSTGSFAMELSWKPSDREKKLIQKTWSDDFGLLYQLGSDIYAYVFNRCPEAKDLFPTLVDAGDDFRECKAFKTQALKFVQVLSHAINYLSQLDRLEPMLVNIGRTHKRYQAKGFKVEHWSLFQDAIQVIMKNHVEKLTTFTEEERIEAIKQWDLLALFVIQKMYKGFVEKEETPKKISFAKRHKCSLCQSTNLYCSCSVHEK